MFRQYFTSKILYLIFVVTSTNLCVFTGGALVTWSSVVLPRLKTTDGEENIFGRNITSGEQSLITSFLPLGGVVGTLLPSLTVDSIGRKNSLLFTSGIPLAASLLGTTAAVDIILLYITRFISGIAFGSAFLTLHIYLAEISEVSHRGIVTSSLNISVIVGELLSYVVGPYVSIKTLNIVITTFSILFVITFAFCPETPYYFAAKNDIRAARKSLVKLRRRDDEKLTLELETIVETVKKDLKTKRSIFDIFTVKKNRKAFLICFGLYTFQQLSGIAGILYYTHDIFSTTGSSIDTNLSVIIVGIIQLLSSLITPIYIERSGRKKLLLISTVGSFLSELPMGFYYYFKDQNYDVSSINWLPLLCLVSFMIFFVPGLGGVVGVILGEIFSIDVKAIASTIITCYCWILAFLISYLFLNITQTFTIAGTFFMFAGFSFLATWFTLFFVFETEGKSFQEIQNQLEK